MAFNIGNRPVRIAVGVGHANASGGNAYELVKNREVMAVFLALAGQSSGFDVRCYTPGNGQGMSPLSLDGVVYATVHEWLRQGWGPDIVFEIHHEGLGNTNVRGGFVIYPDSAGLNGRNAAGGHHIDTDVREAGPEMARIITGAIGVPRRGDGTMSERGTGVATGPGRWRLGYFGALSDAWFRNNACVFISEAATYTNLTDKAIMDRPDFAAKEARGLLEAIAYLAKSRGAWSFPYKIGGSTPAPAPAPQPPTPITAGDVVKTTARLNVRRGYGLGYPVIATLDPETAATVGKDPDGRHVVEADGYTWINIAFGRDSGWAAANWLKRVAPPKPPAPPQGKPFTMRYDLPLRTEAGFNGTITRTLPAGTKGEITGELKTVDGIGWYPATVGNERGWVPASILRALELG